MMPAHITRLMTFAQHGEPKGYAASDMMRADLEALILSAHEAATRAEVLSDVDPVVLECWKLQDRKVGAMLREAQAAVIELQEQAADGVPTQAVQGAPKSRCASECDLICQQPDGHGGCAKRSTPEQAVQGADQLDAQRYRWLRDKSDPGICAFYLSVGQAFAHIKFARETVDQAIDDQIARDSNGAGVPSGEVGNG